MPKNPRGGLNRGLGQMMQTNPSGHNGSIREIPITEISNRKDQPRKNFNEESLAELAASIRVHGILQPILVRPLNGKYEIVAGERRWRAAQMAEKTTVPVIVKTVEDAELPELALIENLQREDLDALEEAAAYLSLSENFHLTHEEIAEKLGKSRAYITNTLRLLQLPEALCAMLRKGELTPGHCRALLRLSGEEQQINIARRILAQALSVRQTEELVQSIVEPHEKTEIETPKDPNALYKQQLEERLQLYFGGKIKVSGKGKKGKIELYYHDNEELSRILEIMGLDAEE